MKPLAAILLMFVAFPALADEGRHPSIGRNDAEKPPAEPNICRELRAEIIATQSAPLTNRAALVRQIYLTGGCDLTTLLADLGFRNR